MLYVEAEILPKFEEILGNRRGKPKFAVAPPVAPPPRPAPIPPAAPRPATILQYAPQPMAFAPGALPGDA